MSARESVGPTVNPVGDSVRSGERGPDSDSCGQYCVCSGERAVTPVGGTVSARGSIGQTVTPVEVQCPLW